MLDDEYFENCKKIDLMIIEVKRGKCALNGPWTNGHRKNMQKALYAIGAFPGEKINYIAKQLFENHSFEDDIIRCRLISIGSYRDQNLTVVQINLKGMCRRLPTLALENGDYTQPEGE